MRKSLLPIFIFTLVFTTCSIIDLDEAKVSFSFRPKSQKVNINIIRLYFTDKSKMYYLTATDFTLSAGFVRSTKPYSTKMSGSLFINFRFVTLEGDTSAEGNVALPLKSDWHWGVDIFIADRNPMEYCFGCYDYKAFALKPAYRDSLNDSVYVVWGGNSIKNPVIY